MYSVLDNYLVARLVTEFRRVFARNDSVGVDAEFPEDLRKPNQLIVAPQSDSHTQLSASNFYGVLHSYASLAQYPDLSFPGDAISWVTEDPGVEDVAQPGLYFVRVVPREDGEGANAYVTPLFFEVERFEYNEHKNPYILGPTFADAQESSVRVLEKSWERDSRILIHRKHYTFNTTQRSVELTYGAMYQGAPYEVEWWYWGAEYGPFHVRPGEVRRDIVPGTRIIFGDRIFEEDRQIVVIEHNRGEIADVYAGHWKVSVNLSVFSQSKIERGRISTRAKDALVQDLFHKLGAEGMPIEGVTSSRAAEVQYDTPNEYQFQDDITFDITVPWYHAETYLVPLQAISIIDNAPDYFSDLAAAKAETGRFIYRTKFDRLLTSWDIERIK